MLQKLLNDLVLDPKNTRKMYDLALEYDRLEQGAAAAMFYLRAAENEEHDILLQYKCQIKMALIHKRERDRWHTLKGIIENAIALIPNRPEAYYFASKWFQEIDEWRPALMFASIGLQYIDIDEDIGVGYPGKDEFKHIYGKALWRYNGEDGGKKYLFNLRNDKSINPKTKNDIQATIDEIGYPQRFEYTSENMEGYMFPFNGIETIEKNYSRSFQDMFVLSVLNGKRNGMFIDLGCGNPTENNDTFLLETKFGWKGISVDNNETYCYNYSRKRDSTILLKDVSEIDLNELFKINCVEEHIDYLRISAEHSSIDVLRKIPFNHYKFSVIQFQHNECWWGNDVKAESRKILSDMGYILMVNDVSLNLTQSYEDWWVHPDYYNQKMNSSKQITFIWDYMMK